MALRISQLRLLPVLSLALVAACSSSSIGTPKEPEVERLPGQTSFQSAPPGGTTGGGRAADGALSSGAAPANAGPEKSASTSVPERKVEETDLYRLEGDRLYYLNAYRGLMVFDVSNVDAPKLLGRSAIYGSPVEMIVRNGVAVVVVGDWYGKNADGTPFHGSVVRGFDATDPTNIKTTGEARMAGWVRDTRIVGDVLYAVSEDYGWYYGMWDYGYFGGGYAGGVSSSGPTGPKVVISSVSFGGGQIAAKGQKEFSGYSAIFNVTPTAIMLAHDIPQDANQPYSGSSGTSELQYIDIADPAGAIALRGKAVVNGSLQGYGADNGRWNLDFADRRYAHVLACKGNYCGGDQGHFLTTVDFENPDAPKKASEIAIGPNGWSAAARFDGTRMYLSPGSGYYYGGNNTTGTPIQIYDLADPLAPKLAGSTEVPGAVWNFIPSGNRLFALGNEYGPNYSGNKVSLRYLDVTDATKPSVIGTSSFGDGWAWTPAAGTFKAFTKDDGQGLVVLPFSGWSQESGKYNNGLQLIEFSPTSIKTSGAAKTRGWVERGIFVKSRLVSLSDLALTVVDYADKNNPRVVKELTLARNVVSAQPQGNTMAQLSSDWWDYDQTTTELRVMPLKDAEESTDTAAAASLAIDGYNARVFRNGDLAYVVTNVNTKTTCANGGVGTPEGKGGGTYECTTSTPQVQVVDLANGKAIAHGKISLPVSPNGYYGGGWGWGGCYWYDWFDGASAIQVNGDVLAFRRWAPVYKENGRWEADQQLYVVDLKNADAPTVASIAITTDTNGWWGNMRAVGDKLYTSHYDWISFPTEQSPNGVVKYYLDQIDLSDRQHPKVGSKINVPGMLVGASQDDPSLLYTIDYRWFGNQTHDELSVVKVQGDLAYLQSTTPLEGYVGNVFVRGSKAFMTAQRYVEPTMNGVPDPNAGPRLALHEIDLQNPQAPVDRVSSDKKGWGWLLGVEGDRAIVTSGWGNQGIDIFKLSPSAAPVFDQFVRTRGWGTSSLARQDSALYLASGYWGVQKVDLQ